MLFFMVGLVLAQTDRDIDTLLSQFYQPLIKNNLGTPHFECSPVFMFPYFATGEPEPPLKEQWKGYTGKRGSHSYYKFYDQEGVHFIFCGLSYYLDENETTPQSKTYRMFFYTTDQGKWVQEMDPLVAVFDLTGDMQYSPRLGGPAPHRIHHQHTIVHNSVQKGYSPLIPKNRFELRLTP